MTELSFHRDLYTEAAVRDAVSRYATYAEIACAEGPDGLRVSISNAKPEREQRIARELANFALGLTIRQRKE